METGDLELLFELSEDTPRQAPGSIDSTRRALRLLPDSLRIERVLDLGCGTGGSTIVLAEHTGAAACGQCKHEQGCRDSVVDEHDFLRRLIGHECDVLMSRRSSVAHGQSTAAAYVPLSFEPGEAYQFDWSHEVVLLGGMPLTVKAAHLRLCHSRLPFVRVYPRETQSL